MLTTTQPSTKSSVLVAVSPMEMLRREKGTRGQRRRRRLILRPCAVSAVSRAANLGRECKASEETSRRRALVRRKERQQPIEAVVVTTTEATRTGRGPLRMSLGGWVGEIDWDWVGGWDRCCLPVQVSA